jgi:hypothetical protein
MASHILPVAVNKRGVMCGNCCEAVSDNAPQVDGSVDRDSRLAAWPMGGREGTAFDAGRNCLTQDQTTVPVHFSKERTQQMVPGRPEEPKDGTKERVSVRQVGSAAGHQPPNGVFHE